MENLVNSTTGDRNITVTLNVTNTTLIKQLINMNTKIVAAYEKISTRVSGYQKH